jgi:hypothetical protein
VRELLSTVGKLDEPVSETLGRCRIVDGDLGDDRLQMLDRFIGPDDLQSPTRGFGSRLALPQDWSQRRTAPWLITRPAAISASARASDLASASGESNKPLSDFMTAS